MEESTIKKIAPKLRGDVKKHLLQWRKYLSHHKTEQILRVKVYFIWIFLDTQSQPWTWQQCRPLLLTHSFFRLTDPIRDVDRMFVSPKINMLKS